MIDSIETLIAKFKQENPNDVITKSDLDRIMILYQTINSSIGNINWLTDYADGEWIISEGMKYPNEINAYAFYHHFLSDEFIEIFTYLEFIKMLSKWIKVIKDTA